MKKFILVLVFILATVSSSFGQIDSNGLATLFKVKSLELRVNNSNKDYYFYYEDLIGGKMPHYVGNTESLKDFSSKLKSFIDSTLLYKGNKSFSCECGKKYLIIFHPKGKVYGIIFKYQADYISVIEGYKIFYTYDEMRRISDSLQSIN